MKRTNLRLLAHIFSLFAWSNLQNFGRHPRIGICSCSVNSLLTFLKQYGLIFQLQEVAVYHYYEHCARGIQ
jgi:hypothetical protein